MVIDKRKDLFRIEGVTKIYGRQFIFNNVSFTIKSSEILGIIGKSGSGKTTFLNMLIGFVKPEVGDILFRDKHLINSIDDTAMVSVFKNNKILKKMYGFASQKPSFYPNLTAMENLMYFGSLYDIPKKSLELNAKSLLKLVDLDYSKNVIAKCMSGGMQKRLNIACSLIHDPKILILDEPTSDLDPILSGKIWEILQEVNDKGTTIIIVSHNISELEDLCDRLIIFKDGNVAANGSPSEIKACHSLEESIFLQSKPGNYKKIMTALKKTSDKSIKDWNSKNKKLTIDTSNTSSVIRELMKILDIQNEQILEIEISKPSLDKIFVEIENSKLVINVDENKIRNPKKFKNKHKAKVKKTKHRKSRRHKKSASKSTSKTETKNVDDKENGAGPK